MRRFVSTLGFAYEIKWNAYCFHHQPALPVTGGSDQLSGSSYHCTAQLPPQCPPHTAGSPWKPADQVSSGSTPVWKVQNLISHLRQTPKALIGRLFVCYMLCITFQWTKCFVNVLWMLDIRLTAASDKPARRFQSRKIRSNVSDGDEFYHQPSITATVSSGLMETFKWVTLNVLWKYLFKNCFLHVLCAGEQLTVLQTRPDSPIPSYGKKNKNKQKSWFSSDVGFLPPNVPVCCSISIYFHFDTLKGAYCYVNFFSGHKLVCSEYQGYSGLGLILFCCFFKFFYSIKF